MTSYLEQLGAILFRWRNIIFPVLVLLLYASARPATTLFGSAWLECAADYAGYALIVLGLLIRLSVIGFIYVPRDGDNKTAHADALFTGGMFALSRNPLYVGNMCLYAGVFLMHAALPVLIGGIVLFWIIYQAIIANEERFLRGKFGAAYADYCATVPRWLSLRMPLRKVRENMRFDAAQAIKTEYNVISQAILIVALAIWYEAATSWPPLISWLMLVGLVGFVALMKWIKAKDRTTDVG